MAQIIPSITSLPVDSSAAPSAEDIQDRLPSICVDYLSHNWNEEDVWASWRSMTRHKNEIANGTRLENASWRTWQKQRNKLKTISPETLNWLKDSDVTWLYGPLHTAQVEPVRPLRVSKTEDRLGIDNPAKQPNHKPILKHRTLSEMLTIPMPSSPILESSGLHGEDDVDELDGDRPQLLQTKSDTNIVRANVARKRSPPRGPISGKATPAGGEMSPPLHSAVSNKKHISFNTFVEQRISVDELLVVSESEDDSEDDMLEMRSSSYSSSSRSSRPSISRVSSSSSSGEPLTIAKIAPAMLKTTAGILPAPSPAMVYAPPPEYMSPKVSQSPSDYDFPSPQITQKTNKWAGDDDEYGSEQFDYFGGPDLGAEDASPVHAYETPVVSAPPAQPKWRQSEPTIPSTSSSSSSLGGAVSPQQPSRGILKVRPPGAAPVESNSPPTPSSFVFNPSMATGMGGMKSGAIEVPNSTPSPIPSPVIVEERGRSASRERGTSQFDRSTSRGTSSTHSISPSAARSPVEPARPRVQTLDKVPEGSVPQSWEPMEVDYVAERSSTPTPHSSPQISLRPLADTSPASLPHTSTRTPDLPTPDAPKTIASKSLLKPTVAHVPTNAQPVLSTPMSTLPTSSSSTDEDDGSSIMGRAANIASTAKDLLGALWYGNEEAATRQSPKGKHGRAASMS
ncbi:hypothetical protein P7C73_g4597, partial [Tremellales sp. Uapishka_1]